MARKLTSNHAFEAIRRKTKRKGIHAKTKTSNSKSSSKYKKAYRGQGR
jgi:hypothetical protein